MPLTQYPAVNPGLLMDFAGSKTIDSRLINDRASTAVNMGPTGYLVGVANKVTRLDYDPLTGACLGMLVEDQRTNLCTYSDDLSNANYRKYNGTVTTNATTAPDGSSGADFFQGNGSAGLGMDTYPNDYGSSGNEMQTFSVYVKANGVNTIQLTLANAGPTFNLSTGTISNVGGFTAEIQALRNGWYRISATTVKSNIYWYWGATLNGGSAVSAGSGMFMWGFQIENSHFATSYIPTAASTVTRAADIPYVISPPFGSTISGTYMFEGRPREDGYSAKYTFLTAWFSGSTFQLGFEASSTGGNLLANCRGVTAVIGALSTTPAYMKLAMSFDSTGVAASKDGGAVQTNNTPPTIAYGNWYFIGNTFFGSGSYSALNGTVSRIVYWQQKVDNSFLPTLTALT